MSVQSPSVLILVLMSLLSPEHAQTSLAHTPVPKAPIPEVAATLSPVQELNKELEQLTFGPKANQATPATTTTPAPPRPLGAEVTVNMAPLGKDYVRLAPPQVGVQAKAQVSALAKAFTPKASGKQGLPIAWLPRETRKALGGNGPRDVVLLAATPAFAWYVWAEADAAWIGRVDLADPTTIYAGSLPASGAVIVPGPQRLIITPDQPLRILDSNNQPVALISR